MTERTLTITQTPDWRAGLRAAGKAALRGRYAGEVLNFESPSQFFGQLTEKRWELVRAAQGRGALPVRELARLVERVVRRVHDDVVVLADLGLLERTEGGGVICPFATVHVDFKLVPVAA